MHDALKGFYDLHDAKTRDHCRCAKAQGAQVLGVLNPIERHLLELEQQAQLAGDMADPDAALENNINHVHRQVAMVRERAAAFRAAWRDLSQSLTALPGQIDVSKTNVLNVLQARRPAGDQSTLA